ncbi:GerAB/ArcD/ProY family transporter [Paenibacillus albus]|uniref:Uncharacterized protein n=1 Tax=Paenibacillus albus TaxID=2495582 RepID=A0A3Q8X3S4_9BACL|nr:GerAB/ArcD/ProY family transporter [Paenibacillus albus]AZN39778.1 hypothetical protein EJC50_09080 [Paenibacillus albus]
MRNVYLPIGPIQLFCLLFQAQFGLGILSLPHSVNAAAGSDGWIACLFGGLLNCVLLLAVWKLSAYDRSKTVFQMVRRRLGPFFGNFLILVVAIYSITVCYETTQNWIFISSNWAFEQTPAWVLALLLVGVSAYLTSKPLRVFARFAVVAMAFVPLFVGLICYTLKDANLDLVLPVFSSAPAKIASSAWDSMMSFVGIEVLMVLSPCYQMPSKTVLRVAFLANLAITAIYMLCVFSTTVIFGNEMISFIREPLLFQFKTISFKIIERMDLIVLTIWILFMVTTLTTYLLLFVSSMTTIAGSKSGIRLPLLITTAVVLFMLGAWNLGVSQLTRLQDFIGRYVPMVIIGIPIVMLLMIGLSKWLSGGKEVQT